MPTLVRACEQTFQYRKTEFDLVKIQELLERLMVDDSFQKRWNAYAKKNNYVHGLSFEAVILDAIRLINKMS